MSTYYLQELQKNMERIEAMTANLSDEKTIHINILGLPEVRVGGKHLDMTNYNAPKSWNIIVFLALQMKATSSITIAETLWPDVDPVKATDNVRSAVYQIRNRFHVLCSELIRNGKQGYWFNPEYKVIVDAQTLDDLWKEASSLKEHLPKLDVLKKAVTLYRGHLYDDRCSDQWTISAYHHYSKVYAEVITALLDELGIEENYSEIHEYATESMNVMTGIMRVYFWLVVSTCMISRYEAAKQTMESLVDEFE